MFSQMEYFHTIVAFLRVFLLVLLKIQKKLLLKSVADTLHTLRFLNSVGILSDLKQRCYFQFLMSPLRILPF